MSLELAGILITIIFQGLYVAFKLGKFEEKLVTLEKKQDKHNNLITRMYKVENDVEKAHTRIDYLEKNEHFTD